MSYKLENKIRIKKPIGFVLAHPGSTASGLLILNFAYNKAIILENRSLYTQMLLVSEERATNISKANQ